MRNPADPIFDHHHAGGETYDVEKHGKLLTPDEAVERLWRMHSIKLSAGRLAEYRCYGSGPTFLKQTRHAVRYPEKLLDAWAAKRNAKPLLNSAPVKGTVWAAADDQDEIPRRSQKRHPTAA